jgi:hypothetical protein
VTQRLLALLQEVPASSGYGHLNQIAEELGHPAPEQVLEFGARLLEELRARGVLLGTRRTPP